MYGACHIYDGRFEPVQVAAKPGALFAEDKPASANDSWRKLHSDPLLLIRQQEQAAIAKIKSNPVKMAEIKKAVSILSYVLLR